MLILLYMRGGHSFALYECKWKEIEGGKREDNSEVSVFKKSASIAVDVHVKPGATAGADPRYFKSGGC